MPIVRSAVANSAANTSASRSSPVRRSVSSPPSIAFLAAARASAGPFANWAGPGPGRVVHLGRRHHLVHQPDLQRLGRLHHSAGEDQVLGPRGADQPGHPLGAAASRDDPEQDLRLAQLGVVGAHPAVAAQRHLHAAAQGVTGDRGHGRLGHLGQRAEAGGQPAGHRSDVRVGHAGHLLDVGTRGEHLLPAVHHDRAHVRAPAGLLGAALQLLLHLPAERVHRGPVQPDGAHAAVDLEPHEFAHGGTLGQSSPQPGRVAAASPAHPERQPERRASGSRR